MFNKHRILDKNSSSGSNIKLNPEKNEYSQIKTSSSSVSIANSDDSSANSDKLPKKICVGRGLLMSILPFY